MRNKKRSCTSWTSKWRTWNRPFHTSFREGKTEYVTSCHHLPPWYFTEAQRPLSTLSPRHHTETRIIIITIKEEASPSCDDDRRLIGTRFMCCLNVCGKVGKPQDENGETDGGGREREQTHKEREKRHVTCYSRIAVGCCGAFRPSSWSCRCCSLFLQSDCKRLKIG